MAMGTPSVDNSADFKLVPQVTDHSNIHSALAFSPDNRLLVVGGFGMTFWDTTGYFIVRHVPDTHFNINFLAFTKDGNELVAASRQSGRIAVYDLAKGEATHHSGALRGRITAFDISRNRKFVVVGTSAGDLEIFNAASLAVISTATVAHGEITNVSFLGDDGNIVFTGADDESALKLCDRNGSFLRAYTYAPAVKISAFAVSGDKKRVALGYGARLEFLDEKLRVIGKTVLKESPSVIVAHQWHSPIIEKLALNGDGTFAAASGNSWVKGFDVARSSTVFEERLVFKTPPGFMGAKPGLVYTLNDSVGPECSLVFSPDGKRLALTTGFSPPRVLSAGTGALLESLGREIDPTLAAAFIPGTHSIVSALPLKRWDLAGDLKVLARDRMAVTQVMATDGGRRIISNPDKSIVVRDRNGRILKELPSQYQSPFGISESSGILVYVGPKGTEKGKPEERSIRIVSMKDWRLLREIPAGDKHIFRLFVDDTGRFVACDSGVWDLKLRRFHPPTWKGAVVGALFDKGIIAIGRPGRLTMLHLWDRNTVELGVTGYVSALKFSPSGKLMALVDSTNIVRTVRLSDFRIVSVFRDNTRRVTGLDFSDDGRMLLSVSDNGRLMVWNLEDQQGLTLASKGTEWVMASPDGYFDASSHGTELLAEVAGLSGYGMEQFATVKNRPDLILERMGLGTSEEMGYFRSLYQRRLKKSGIQDPSAMPAENIPVAAIRKVVREGKFAVVDFALSAAGPGLKRFNIYVNGVPLPGDPGRKIGGNTYNGSERIELTPGRNKIEISAVNTAGAESLRAAAYADYVGKEKGDLYLMAVGISGYKDPSLALGYAAKDARDLARTMSEMKGSYAAVHVKTLLNSEATAKNIHKLSGFLKDAKTGDTVVLFIAGHGGYDQGPDPKYYFLPYEADRRDLTGSGVVYKSIAGLLDGIKPRKKLLLLDTCGSGELDEDTFDNYYAAAEVSGFAPRTSRKPDKSRRAARSRIPGRAWLLARNRFIYNDMFQQSGTIVFSSSRGDEISYESPEINNGFFTHELIDALTTRNADANFDGKVDVHELLDYVSRTVAEKTGGLQHPTIDRDNPTQDIYIPLVLSEEDRAQKVTVPEVYEFPPVNMDLNKLPRK